MFLSKHGLTEVLNLFHTPSIQMAVVKEAWVEIRPTICLVDENAMDIEISRSGTEFLDLANTFSKVKVCVTPAVNAGFLTGVQVVTVKYPFAKYVHQGQCYAKWEKHMLR